MKRAAAFLASFLLAALPFGASAADAQADAGSAAESAKGKSIVVYFSASGIAELTGSDLMEIVPEEKYTEADLNWHDGESRTSLEKDDQSIRPAIKPDTRNLADYDTVFLGYPIWWGHAPKVVHHALQLRGRERQNAPEALRQQRNLEGREEVPGAPLRQRHQQLGE